MPGSPQININMGIWAASKQKRLEAAMDSHIKNSANFAKSNRKWENRTGSATAGLKGQTESSPTQIVSSVGHHVEHGLYLEKAWFFHGRYKILERARDNNIWFLFANLNRIMMD